MVVMHNGKGTPENPKNETPEAIIQHLNKALPANVTRKMTSKRNIRWSPAKFPREEWLTFLPLWDFELEFPTLRSNFTHQHVHASQEVLDALKADGVLEKAEVGMMKVLPMLRVREAVHGHQTAFELFMVYKRHDTKGKTRYDKLHRIKDECEASGTPLKTFKLWVNDSYRTNLADSGMTLVPSTTGFQQKATQKWLNMFIHEEAFKECVYDVAYRGILKPEKYLLARTKLKGTREII